MSEELDSSIRAGKFRDALEASKDWVRRAPGDYRARLTLFKLYAIHGDWQRAKVQLDTYSQLHREGLMYSAVFGRLADLERVRENVFRGDTRPLFFGEPDEWMGHLAQALPMTSHPDQIEKAAEYRDDAFEAAPVSSGTIDGVAFDWIADSDNRLGPILEAYVGGDYYWIPFSRIKSIQMDPTKDMLDLVWMPAKFEWINEGAVSGYIPTRYVGSCEGDGDAILSCRETRWAEKAAGYYYGSGCRLFVTNEADHGLTAIGSIILNGTPGENSGENSVSNS